ncbi:hypothetical protein BST13_37220, partial [Mycobacterium aquaticum]
MSVLANRDAVTYAQVMADARTAVWPGHLAATTAGLAAMAAAAVGIVAVAIVVVDRAPVEPTGAVIPTVSVTVPPPPPPSPA